MFKSRMILLLLLAGILSIFASILIRKLVSKPAVQVEVPVISKDGKKAIIVAANDIPFLKLIKEDDTWLFNVLHELVKTIASPCSIDDDSGYT
mgnify:CR=1 FL=1